MAKTVESIQGEIVNSTVEYCLKETISGMNFKFTFSDM